MTGFTKDSAKKNNSQKQPAIQAARKSSKNYLFKLQQYTIAELAELYRISPKTLRKKLAALDNNQILGRKFGRRFTTRQVEFIFENVKGPFFSIKYLASIYNRSHKTIPRWLEPISKELGEKDGGYYNLEQLKIIVDFLDLPPNNFDDPHLDKIFFDSNNQIEE